MSNLSRAKCGNGFDDATLEKLQDDFKPTMTKISKNPNQVPKWCNISRELVPDFIVIDPKKSPVWEITVLDIFHLDSIQLFFSFLFQGAEFSKSKQHTANGISIRFPRVTKVREDKTWKEATNLQYLTELFEKSKPSKKENNNNDDDEDEGKEKRTGQRERRRIPGNNVPHIYFQIQSVNENV